MGDFTIFWRLLNILGRIARRRSRPLRLLVDVRETPTSRGFHALAVLNLIAAHLADVTLFLLTTGDGDEMSAIEVFRADHGVTATILTEPELELDSLRFDLVFAVAEAAGDPASEPQFAGRARRSLIGAMFQQIPPRHGMVVVDGHDTAAMARSLARLIDPLAIDPSFTTRPVSCAS
ncbi:hypothetical protein [Ancylobacter sp. TS-1]|uniref:hypothetical protein n=1 Tax=Ancylobacter sp. TS-1 TaxID=1850374 RepID=UPI001265BD14|nr:hypothetical protein [Ancylobacter sp. TS-1]QFR33493.1 hypothetical protein GBB76_10320 [Ancylobacter sp. TS-1]